MNGGGESGSKRYQKSERVDHLEAALKRIDTKRKERAGAVGNTEKEKKGKKCGE